MTHSFEPNMQRLQSAPARVGEGSMLSAEAPSQPDAVSVWESDKRQSVSARWSSSRSLRFQAVCIMRPPYLAMRLLRHVRRPRADPRARAHRQPSQTRCPSGRRLSVRRSDE